MQSEVSKEVDKPTVNGHNRENFILNSKPLLEQRPRSTGFKSFLNWFKKVENSQRNVDDEISSLSESSADDSSTSSTATVASFAFLPANIYRPYGDACQPEKFIASGPYTETYHRLIAERNRRKNLDKNLSLRKKYSLYSSGTLGNRVDTILMPNEKVVHAENVNYIHVYDTFSLPSIAKKGDYEEVFNDNRKTASLSSKDTKSSINCHVKGKRKAPQPPGRNVEFTKTYRKKRQAPPPPKQILYSCQVTEKHTAVLPDTDQSNKITPNKVENKLVPLDMDKAKIASTTQSELSPKPWYKRQISENKQKSKSSKNNSDKKKNKNEYPEVGFFRCSRIFENKKMPNDNHELEKQEKRASCLLPNISELDREAAEIIKLHRKDLECQPEGIKENMVSKPSSARDLINKFNALTNVTESVKDEGNGSNEKSPLGILARKNINSPINIPEKNGINELFLNNTKPIIDKAKEQKKRFCPCGLENITSGNKCIKCINERLSASGAIKKENEKDNIKFEDTNSFQNEVFSAIENFNFSENKISSPVLNLKNDSNKHNKLTDVEEKYRLRELLKEMKNSLPKRPKPVKSSAINSNIITSTEEPKSDIDISPTQISPKSETPLTINKITSSNIPEITKSKINGDDIPSVSSQIKKDNVLQEKKFNVNIEKSKLIILDKIDFNSKKSDEENNINIEKPSPRNSIINKVNSSAQTNCVAKRNDQLVANKPNKDNPDNDLKESHAGINQTEMDTTKKEALQSKTASNALYTNLQESRLAFPKPKIVEQQNSNPNTKLLLKQLETAIAQGNDLLAAKLAKDLALLKVNCSVTSTATINAKEINVKSIQIYIEDQFSHQGPITIRIKEDITIAGLKLRVFEELHIPTGVQRWIIGKQLTIDENLPLSHFNGNDFTNPLFLYVVAPEVQQDKESHKLKKTNDETKPVAGALQMDDARQKGKKVLKNSENIALSQPTPKVDEISKIKGEQAIQGPSKIKVKTEAPAMKDVIKKTWVCSACTLINSLLSPLCSACGTRKSVGPEKKAEEEKPQIKPKENKEHYLQLVNLDSADLVLNTEQFECPICLTECRPGAGVTLRECLHSFCKECLAGTVKFSEEAEVKCPYRDREYFCDCTIQEREIKALVNRAQYEQHLAKSVNFAENKIKNAFHCKTSNCKGWCIFEENVNDFYCPVCKKTNCLTCQAIHTGKNCKEYQEQEQQQATSSSEAGKRATKQMLDELVSRGEAMYCPSCHVVLMKKWGCDWLRCSMCKTEICWVTRGARWGPAGKGDTSAGCQCGLNGVKCHPKCNYCH